MQRRSRKKAILSALSAHPAVCDVSFADSPDGPIEISVVASMASLRDADRSYARAAATRKKSWALVFDMVARSKQGGLYSEWTSSYTNEPMGHDEMEEWVACTVAALGELNDRKILEIGCGRGLLAKYIVPLCREYIGTDISKAALAEFDNYVLQGQKRQNVGLLNVAADELASVEADGFDVIILNSVVQYFPDTFYLLDVLSTCFSKLAPEGRIFIGDVRDSRCRTIFYDMIELGRADDEPVQRLRERSRERALAERELTIDPAIFRTLPRILPDASVVSLSKRGVSDNEMTQFRYDVIVGKSEGSLDATVPMLVRAGSVCEAIEICGKDTGVIALVSLPNARLTGSIASHRLLNEMEDASIWELRECLTQTDPEGVHPEAAARQAEQAGFHTLLFRPEDEPVGWFTLAISQVPLVGPMLQHARQNGAAKTEERTRHSSALEVEAIALLQEQLSALLPSGDVDLRIRLA